MLLWVNRKVGEKKVVFVYEVLAIGCAYNTPGPLLRLISDVDRLKITSV